MKLLFSLVTSSNNRTFERQSLLAFWKKSLSAGEVGGGRVLAIDHCTGTPAVNSKGTPRQHIKTAQPMGIAAWCSINQWACCSIHQWACCSINQWACCSINQWACCSIKQPTPRHCTWGGRPRRNVVTFSKLDTEAEHMRSFPSYIRHLCEFIGFSPRCFAPRFCFYLNELKSVQPIEKTHVKTFFQL